MTKGARRISLALLTAINAFGFIDRIVIALVAQDLKADLLISDLQIGLLAGTAFAAINAIAGLPIARIAERRRRSLVAALSLLVGSIFTALCALTNSFVQLVVLRLGMAAGSAGTEAPPHSMISDLYEPHRRASALSLFMLGVPLAAVLGSYAGGTLTQIYGWRTTFLAFGLCGAAVAMVAWLALPEPPRHSDPAGSAGVPSLTAVIGTLWRHVHFRHVLSGAALVSLGSFGVNTFLPAFFVRNFALGMGQAGLLFGLVSGIASAAGTLMGGFGSEWLARRHPGWLLGLPALGLVAGAPLFVLGATRTTLTAAVPIILAGSCFFYMSMGPAIATVHGLLDSRSRATGSAVFLLAMHLVGQGLGPPLAGFVSDHVAAWRFGSGDFAAACAGAATLVPHSRCALASAAGVRCAIASFALVYLWASIHFGFAARPGGSAVGAATPAPNGSMEL